MDSNLLKEAIADAKAVRQTALANAKVALEEAFSERYHAMFAEKLREDAEMGDTQPAAAGTMKTGTSVSEQEIDELIKELEQEVGDQPEQPPMEDPMAAGAPAPAPMAPPVPGLPGAPLVPGAVPPGCPSPIGAVPPIGGPVPGAPVDIGAPAPAVPGLPGAPAPVAPAPVAPPSEVPPVDGQETDEDVNLDELLQSLKEEIEGDEEKKDKEEELDENTKLSSSGIAPGGNKKPSSSASSSSHIETGGTKDNGQPQSKVITQDATEASRPNSDGEFENTPKLAKEGIALKNKGVPEGKVGPEDATTASRPNSDGEFENTAKLTSENVALKKQLNEAEEVIKYVKVQLNEVNLLNAKLLYTNKLFKEYAMHNEQKMRVVEMFDLAKNVREVKLTYANIAESLNFSGTDRKKSSKESSAVQSITEGLASKPVGSTKPSKEIISENKTSSMVSKFQKLAGIKSKVSE